MIPHWSVPYWDRLSDLPGWWDVLERAGYMGLWAC